MRAFFDLVLKFLTFINDRLVAVYKQLRNKPLVFGICLLLFVVTGALLFDCKIFLMGDDADYILDAFKFDHNNVFLVKKKIFQSIYWVG